MDSWRNYVKQSGTSTDTTNDHFWASIPGRSLERRPVARLETPGAWPAPSRPKHVTSIAPSGHLVGVMENVGQLCRSLWHLVVGSTFTTEGWMSRPLMPWSRHGVLLMSFSMEDRGGPGHHGDR
jgi:hypothetical protein